MYNTIISCIFLMYQTYFEKVKISVSFYLFSFVFIKSKNENAHTKGNFDAFYIKSII